MGAKNDGNADEEGTNDDQGPIPVRSAADIGRGPCSKPATPRRQTNATYSRACCVLDRGHFTRKDKELSGLPDHLAAELLLTLPRRKFAQGRRDHDLWFPWPALAGRCHSTQPTAHSAPLRRGPRSASAHWRVIGLDQARKCADVVVDAVLAEIGSARPAGPGIGMSYPCDLLSDSNHSSRGLRRKRGSSSAGAMRDSRCQIYERLP